MLCKHCGANFDLTGLISTCPICGNMVSQTTELNSNAKTHHTNSIPMEDSSYAEKPFIAIIDTIRECFLKPAHFFSNIKNNSGKLVPVTFCLVLGSIGAVSTMVWNRLLPKSFWNFGEATLSNSALQDSTTSSLLFTPIFLIIGIFVVSAYIQIILKITRSCNAPFNMTFRTVCYAQSSAILMVIPWIGGVFSLLYWIYFILTGIHTVHNINRTKALMLFLIVPIVLFTVLLTISLIIAIAIGLLAGNNLKWFFP